MNTHPRLRAALLTICIVSCGLLGLTSCMPGAQLTSPVGVWVAVGDDNGVLTIRQDGTFTVSNSSFNPIQYRDTEDNYNASGTWRTFPGKKEVKFDFLNARESDFTVQPGGRTVPFKSGSIRFQDPDNFYDIEFRIVDEGSN